MIGYFGKGAYGKSPYGGTSGDLRVHSAEAPNPYTVLVQFTQPLDVAFPPILSPANYTIPGLTVISAEFASINTIRLTTSEQSYALYTVTVGQARSTAGLPLDVVYRTANFTGFAINPGFIAKALTKRRIRLQFSLTMQADVNLTNLASYGVRMIDGNILPIDSVELEQPSNVLSLVLTLGTDLVSLEWYAVYVSLAVKSTGGLSLVPNTRTIQYVETSKSFTATLSSFTGEVQGGLYGNPLGLVFFSPALEVPLANSVIQIDQVDVCTTAYDTYVPPSPVDPKALYTWQQGGPQTGLGQSGVALWAPFPRLVEAKLELGAIYEETVPPPHSGRAEIQVREPWDKDFVSLLNNTYWGLFTPVGPPPVAFITANNLAPIPPGPMTTILVGDPSSASMVASSVVTAAASGVFSAAGTLTADSGVAADLVVS